MAAAAARFDLHPGAFAPVSRSEAGLIVAVVLAAGTSSRLGRPKQLLELDGVPLLRHVASRALASTVDRVIVVVGAGGDEVRSALDGLDLDIVENADYATGQSSSLIAGLVAVREQADAIVVLLGDQPGIDPAVIDRALDARRSQGAGIVMAQYGSDRGHPVLFGREHFEELAQISGDQGGRDVVRRHAKRLLLVDGGSDRIPADVDTWSDYGAVRDSWPGSGKM